MFSVSMAANSSLPGELTAIKTIRPSPPHSEGKACFAPLQCSTGFNNPERPHADQGCGWSAARLALTPGTRQHPNLDIDSRRKAQPFVQGLDGLAGGLQNVNE